MELLSKNTIDTWIIPHLTVGSGDFDRSVHLDLFEEDFEKGNIIHSINRNFS